MNPGWERTESPFHAGELEIQAQLGVQEKADKQARRMVRDYLTEQHRQFFAKLPYLIVGTVDAAGAPWASIVVGSPGFLSSPDEHTLVANTQILSGDPLLENLAAGADIGLLGIDLQARRRNRLNGILTAIQEDRFEVQVRQSFGNCPQYIQAREVELVKSQQVAGATERIRELSAKARKLIETADTFFIATAYQAEAAGTASGIDVSHRGGNPGFVEVVGSSRLTIPDFAGNNHFNTIGNLRLNPRAGLLFIEFNSGDLLYLTGSVELDLQHRKTETHPLAQRLLHFKLEEGYWTENALPISWGKPAFSPFLNQASE